MGGCFLKSKKRLGLPGLRTSKLYLADVVRIFTLRFRQNITGPYRTIIRAVRRPPQCTETASTK